MHLLWGCRALALILSSSTSFFVSALPYSEYILAPTSRTLVPVSIYQQGGNVTSASNLLSGGTGSAVFSGLNASVTYDFGKNIAGRVSFNVDSVDGTGEGVDVTFTESSLWINTEYCDGTQNTAALDSPLHFDVTSSGFYTASKERLRGGYRYMTVVHNAMGSISLSNLTIAFTAEPTMVNPAEYSGYFHSDSEKLNRVWYAGAYTNQLCIIDPTEGGALNEPTTYWYYNTTLSNGASVLVDGAKRDRLIWPGDIAVSGPSIYLSTANSDSVKNGLDNLFGSQTADGKLPYFGPASSNDPAYSFTYHLHTLIDLYDYYMFTGDEKYLQSLWDQYKLAMSYTLGRIDDSGLAEVDSNSDWLRNGMEGHNIEANSIFYRALDTGLELAKVLGDDSVTASWTNARDGVQAAANTLLFDSSTNLFKDNEDSTLYPQDGNSYALLSGLVNDTARASAISEALAARWVKPYGAPAPEAGATISPFATGFEIRGHYAAGHPERAVDLMEFMWADFMLDDPRMTNSSFIEGYNVDGTLTYPPYPDNPSRISHAHGWATTPTSALTMLGVGLTYSGGAGSTWKVKPALGGLGAASAGFTTSLGSFSASWSNGGRNGELETPEGTSGSVVISKIEGTTMVSISGPGGKANMEYDDGGVVNFTNLMGGKYTITVT